MQKLILELLRAGEVLEFEAHYNLHRFGCKIQQNYPGDVRSRSFKICVTICIQRDTYLKTRVVANIAAPSFILNVLD